MEISITYIYTFLIILSYVKKYSLSLMSMRTSYNSLNGILNTRRSVQKSGFKS